MALWAAAGMVAVGALVLGVIAVRGGEERPPDLPLATGGVADTQAAAEQAPTGDASFLAAVRYVPADDLPALGGEGPVYRLNDPASADDVRRVADALGIEAEPVEQDGSWHVDDGELSLDVYGPDGAWSAYRIAGQGDAAVSSGGAGGGSSGNTGSTGEEACPPELPPVEPPGHPEEAVAVACGYSVHPAEPRPADPTVIEPEGGGQPAPDLPSHDEAQRIALDLLAATGAAVEGADVRVDDAVTQLFVSVEPVLDGRPVVGLSMGVGIGSGGRIEFASGFLASPERLGDYPLLDTRAALDRFNQGMGQVEPLPVEEPAAAAAEAAPPGEPETTVVTTAPDQGGTTPETIAPPPPANDPPGDGPPLTQVEPPPGVPTTVVVDPAEPTPTETQPPSSVEPPATTVPPTTVPPTEVLVTGAELVLLSTPSWDGSGTYLVLGYRFVTEDGANPVIPAVSDEFLQPPE